MAYFYIDRSICTDCGACVDECPVEAITIHGSNEISDECIGCAACVNACPVNAIKSGGSTSGDIPEDLFPDWLC